MLKISTLELITALIKMLNLWWKKNSNYKKWKENNLPFEKIATIWQRKQVDEKNGINLI